MNVTKVLLIRHGETEWNIIGRWQGILDAPLNDLGYEQAQKLAAYLANEPIQAIYTSDLSRTANTAQLLGNALQLNPIHDKRLRELDIGIFQGLTKPEILQKHPQEFEAFMTQPYNYCIPQGESRRQLQARILEAWQDFIAVEEVEEIAIVSHGGAIKMLLGALFADKEEEFQAQDIPNASITVLKLINETWQMVEFASSSHLGNGSKQVDTDSVYF